MSALVALLLAASTVTAAVAAAAARFASVAGQQTLSGDPADTVRTDIQELKRLILSQRSESADNDRILQLMEIVDDIRRSMVRPGVADRGVLAELVSLSKGLRDLQHQLEPAESVGGSGRTSEISDDDMVFGIREVSHALGAPLVQIFAYAQLLRQFRPDLADSGAEFERYQSGILSGVELCQALLVGYKRIEELVRPTTSADDDLSSTAQRLVEFISADRHDLIDLQVEGDVTGTGYSSTLLMVLACPLLENAVEEVGDRDEAVRFNLKRIDQRLIVTVSNSVSSEVLPERVKEDGFTTKDGHDGIGLSTVERIASAAGGSLILNVSSSAFEAVVTLPVGAR